MDTKALARSKRAHTQHHSRKPHHPNQVSKASVEGTSGTGSAKKSLGKQPTPRPAALPSNWDRYDDEFDSDSGQHLGGNNVSHASDDILPKSKGADYRHLVAEAMSQSQSSVENFPSLDDALPDFNQGVSSMLAVRGEGILSWIGDDSFIVDDRATTSHEASFLSLNLHALAEQLEEIELSNRLFIEADLLPLELRVKGSKTNHQESDKMQTPLESKLPEGEPTDLVFRNFPDKVKITTQSNKVTSSNSRSDLPDHIDIDLKQLGKSGQRQAQESAGKSKPNSAIHGKASASNFKATAAEAELDMLLDSLGQTEVLDSMPGKSKTASIAANIDDVLDDLLGETSNLVNHNAQSIPSPATGTKSKVLDDFDSWLDTI